MSEAQALTDRIAARLERLAEMDLAAAERAHAKLMAAETTEETVSLSRTYQRASRTLRQTLMLQMRGAREQAAAEAEAERRQSRERPWSVADLAFTRLVNARVEDLQAAVGRVAAAAHPDSPRLQREALDRLDIELDQWSDEDDFIDRSLDDMVATACELVRLPADLAREWQDLPEAPNCSTRPKPRRPTPTPADAETGAKRPHF